MTALEIADPLVGRSIANKYVIESRLGGGAMGTVYRARQFALDRAVAIKVMRVELTSDRSFVGRFHREAKAASKLSHPNSISVTDFGEEPDGLLYIVMELVQARDLERIIWEDGLPLSDRRIVDILSQVLSVVAVAHDVGIVHRDLKPANVLVVPGEDDEGNSIEHVKVCDFGIASMRNAAEIEPPSASRAVAPRGHSPSNKKLTAIGTLLGTPEYMSPEQASGNTLEPSSDIYSVGAILYELLTGRTVYLADSPEEMVLHAMAGTPAHPSTVRPCNDQLAAVCMKALSFDPGQRHPSARAMRAELRAALGHVMSSRNPSYRPGPGSGVLARSVPLPETLPPIAMKSSSAERAETLTSTLESRSPTARKRIEDLPRPAAPARTNRRWLVALGVTSVLAMLGGGGLALRTSPPPKPAPQAKAETSVVTPGTPAPGHERASSTTASAADVATDMELPDTTAPRTPPSAAARPGAAAVPVVGAKGSASAARSAEQVVAASAITKPAAEPTKEAPPPAVAAPIVAPPPETAAPAAVAPVVKPYSPDGARVSASVVAAARTPRAGIASIVSHVSFDDCYRATLRQLGRAEGGAGSAHLEIDEDGVVRGVDVRLPAPLASASACFASKLRGQRVSIPDTGAATADIAFALAPN